MVEAYGAMREVDVLEVQVKNSAAVRTECVVCIVRLRHIDKRAKIAATMPQER